MKINNAELVLERGDITKIDTDVVVNAANSSLMGGGGVDGAIHRAGGPTILEECQKIRQSQGICPPGNAVMTSAGKLKAKRVVHTVGPIWRDGKYGEKNILRAAYMNSLELAAQAGMHRVAFPSISTGAYRYPIEQAAHVAIEAIKDFLQNDQRITEVKMVLYSSDDLVVYQRALADFDLSD